MFLLICAGVSFALAPNRHFLIEYPQECRNRNNKQECEMEFYVFRQVLIRALGHMKSIVEKRATLPILMNVKLDVSDDLVLSATNVDLELIEHVAADVTLGGK